MLKYLNLTLIALIMIVIVFFSYQNYKFSQLKYRFNQQNDMEIWAHRGITSDSIAENSIAAFSNASDLGFKGLEIDVFYSDRIDMFIVSHDAIKEGTYFTLEKALEELKDRNLGYWLDFKNSVFLGGKDAITEKSIRRLKLLQDKYNLTRLYVETKSIVFANDLHQNGVKSIYCITSETDNFFDMFQEMSLLNIYEFDALTFDYTKISKKLASKMTGIPIFTYTINDKNDFLKISQYKNVQVVLSDDPEAVKW